MNSACLREAETPSLFTIQTQMMTETRSLFSHVCSNGFNPRFHVLLVHDSLYATLHWFDCFGKKTSLEFEQHEQAALHFRAVQNEIQRHSSSGPLWAVFDETVLFRISTVKLVAFPAQQCADGYLVVTAFMRKRDEYCLYTEPDYVDSLLSARGSVKVLF